MKQGHQNENGHISLIIVIIIVVVILAALGVAAWKLLMNKNNTTNMTTGGSSQTVSDIYSQCMTKYNDGVFCHAAAVQSATPFDKVASIITMTTTDASNNPSTVTMSQDGKGNMSMTSTSTDGTSKFITYGGHNYAQSPTDGTWIDYGGNASSQPVDTTKDLSFLGSMMTVTVKNLGQQPCGNLTCVKYQISDSAQPATTQYVWFDTTNYLMREFQGTNTGQGDVAGTSTMDMKMSYQSVTISAPANAKPLSSMMNSGASY